MLSGIISIGIPSVAENFFSVCFQLKVGLNTISSYQGCLWWQGFPCIDYLLGKRRIRMDRRGLLFWLCASEVTVWIPGYLPVILGSSRKACCRRWKIKIYIKILNIFSCCKHIFFKRQKEIVFGEMIAPPPTSKQFTPIAFGQKKH